MTALALPTGRRGQAVAIGGLTVLLALLWFALLAPLADWYGERAATIDRQTALVDHLAALAARLPALQRQSEATPAPEDATDARAGADLQHQLAAMAQAAGAPLASVEFLPPEAAEGYRRIPLRVALTARFPALIALLTAIEAATPPLLIDDLHVRAAGSEGDATLAAEANFVVVMLRAAPGRGQP